jgi:glycosyltransferase involved in cell wall biosynthesis
MNKKLVIVTPIYEDTESAEKLISKLKDKFQNSLYIVAVDDGSINKPIDINIIKRVEADGVILQLIKNVGHQKAIAIGLQYVSENIDWADRIVVMDSDGEDNPDTIEALLNELNSKDVDIAVGKRKNRSEAFHFQLFYKIYKFIFRLLTGRSFGFGNFVAMKKGSLSRLVKMPEIWTHFAASILSSKLRIAHCPLDRGHRYFGQSKLNFVGFALHGFKALMIFSEEVLVRVGIFCAFVAFLSISGGVIAILLKFMGIATPGWFSVVMGVFVLVFLQTGTLTLMTLLLTGIVKNNPQEISIYDKFIKNVMFSKDNS